MSGGFSNKQEFGDELTADELLWVQTGEDGVVLLKETTAPSFTSGYGKLYTKSSDGLLYFLNDTGTEYDLTGNTTTFGTDNQIPFTNAGGTDFDYSSSLTFDGTQLTVPKIVGGTTTTSDLYFQTTSGVGATGADMHFLVGNNGGTEAMTILNNGNVGINTTAPTGTGSTTLQVAGTGGGSTQYGSLTLSNASGNTGAIGGSVDFYNNNVLTSSIQSVVTSPGSSNDLYFSTKGGGSVAERMRITSDGKVGIGVTPNEQLEITKNFRLPTATATAGIIYKGANRYIHDYGIQSTFMGIDAGNFTHTGEWNTGVGYNALKALTTGSYNNAIGHGAGILLTQGQFNNAMGRNALGLLTTGSSNSAVGNSALGSMTTHSGNTGVGTSTGFATTGSGNVFIGANTGQSLTTSTNGTYIGYQTGLSGTSGLSYAVAIGALAQVTTSNTMALGGTGVSATDVIIGGTTASAKLHVIKTTEQLRVGYDASNYLSATINSTGSATLTLTGTTPEFTFSQAVNVPDEAYGAGWNGSLEVPTKNAIYDKIESFDIVVVKSADETVNNSSTLQFDDELLFSVGANEFWAVTLVVLYDTGTTPDLKLQMSVPTGATALLSNGAFYDSLFFTESTSLNTFGLGIDGIAVFQGYVKTAGTAGSAALQWAQNTADMSDTKVLANSYLIARKLE